MLSGGQTARCVVVLMAAVAGCGADLCSPPPLPPGPWQGGLRLQLPPSWTEMFVLQLGAGDPPSQLLEAARRSALPLTFSTVLTTAADKRQVESWLLRLPMSSTASAGRVVVLAAATPETAWRHLAPRRGRLFLRVYAPSGALLLLALQEAGDGHVLQLLAEALMRLRGVLRLVVLTPTAVLRMEPFERWSRGWGALRLVGTPLPQALDWPAPGVLGRMRGFQLLLTHEPRSDPRLHDGLRRPLWQHSWNGQVLGLIREQLNCSYRLTRVNKDYRILGLYDITYSLWPLVHSNMHQFVNPAVSATRFLVVSTPRRDLPLWTQMARLFRLDVWLTTAAAYVVACSVWYATARAHRWTHGSSVSHSLVDTLCVLLSVSWKTSVTGRCRRALAERCQVGALTLLCLALTAVYQGALTSVVYTPSQTPALKTMEDVNQHKDSILISKAGQTISELQQEHKFLACIEEEIKLKFDTYRIGRPMTVQVVKDPVRTRYSSFAIPSRSPYSDAFNVAFGRLAQAGIIPDPSLYFSTERGLKPKPFLLNIKAVKKRRIVSLSTSDITIAFLVLAIGLSLSCLIFLLETLSEKQICSKFCLRRNIKLQSTELL